MTIPTRVVVAQRQFKMGISFAINRWTWKREWIDALEPRVLLAGNYDLTFGNHGIAGDHRAAGNPYWAQRLVPQHDGWFLVDIAAVYKDTPDPGELVSRVDENGNVDRSFGANGLLRLREAQSATPPSTTVSADYFELDHSGRFLLASAKTANRASGTMTIALARLKSDGSTDLAFGEGGTVEASIPPHPNSLAEARGTIEDFAGRIIVGVAVHDRPVAKHNYFYLARFLPNGSLDTTFGEHGLMEIVPPVDAGVSGRLTQDRYGHMMLSGYTMDINGARQAAIARMLPDGELDTTYGNGGWFITDFGRSDAEFGEPSIDSQGRAVLRFARISSNPESAGQYEVGWTRLNYEGSIDHTFVPTESDHFTIEDWLATDFNILPPIFLQPDDKPIVNFGTGNMLRLNVNGSDDKTFNRTGWAFNWISPIAGDGTPAAFVNNRILVAGWSWEDVEIAGKESFWSTWAVVSVDAGDVIPTPRAPIPILEASPITNGQTEQEGTVFPATIARRVAERANLSNSQFDALASNIIDSRFTDDLLAPAADELLL
jgi:uncharacterized delta-60 repeat protein